MGFTKLDDGFASSSIFSLGLTMVGFWAYLLSQADGDGVVRATIPDMAARCRVTPEEVEALLATLQQPDRWSRTAEHDGRRVDVVRDPEWAVILLNYQKYRAKRDPEERRSQTRDAMRRHREHVSQCEPRLATVSQVSRGEPKQKTEAEAEDRTNVHARGASPANPLIAGRRRELERECLKLVEEIASLTGEDPVEVIAHASGYQGASTTKLNPATMSDDRLAHTLRDLRADAVELRKNAPAKLWVDTCRKIEHLAQETWLNQTKAISLEESTLTVQVPTEEHARWLRAKYVAGLQAALGPIRLRFVTPGPPRPATTAPGPASSSEGGTTASPSRPNP